MGAIYWGNPLEMKLEMKPHNVNGGTGIYHAFASNICECSL